MMSCQQLHSNVICIFRVFYKRVCGSKSCKFAATLKTDLNTLLCFHFYCENELILSSRYQEKL